MARLGRLLSSYLLRKKVSEEGDVVNHTMPIGRYLYPDWNLSEDTNWAQSEILLLGADPGSQKKAQTRTQHRYEIVILII